MPLQLHTPALHLPKQLVKLLHRHFTRRWTEHGLRGARAGDSRSHKNSSQGIRNIRGLSQTLEQGFRALCEERLQRGAAAVLRVEAHRGQHLLENLAPSISGLKRCQPHQARQHQEELCAAFLDHGREGFGLRSEPVQAGSRIKEALESFGVHQVSIAQIPLLLELEQVRSQPWVIGQGWVHLAEPRLHLPEVVLHLHEGAQDSPGHELHEGQGARAKLREVAPEPVQRYPQHFSLQISAALAPGIRDSV
mmetsp:Transcript_5988/g.11228  ORF Transcript_5988/g.11228 Transcript_5988/m.11228 type:complete len:250 (-) Transcript_5988:873-1622(-)